MKNLTQFLTEGSWICGINISDIWSVLENKMDANEEYGSTDIAVAEIKASAKKIAERLKRCPKYGASPELQAITNRFETLDGDPIVEELDSAMEMLYDWADENRVWIKTQD